MRTPENRYRCPLGRLQPKDKPDPEFVKKQGWKEQHILVISPEDDRLDWYEQQLLRNIGNRLYGDQGVHHG